MKILFVCSGNACRSPLADALLKKLRPDVEVDSAGTYPYYKVVDLTRRYAEQEGVMEFLKKVPDGIESKNLRDYNLIIAMEDEHEQALVNQSPECFDKIVVWHINDPYKLPYKQALNLLLNQGYILLLTPVQSYLEQNPSTGIYKKEIM